MFTFKKIALVGVAGLAALAMSCSDDGDDPGGTITLTTVSGSDATGAIVTLAGEVKATGSSNGIETIDFTLSNNLASGTIQYDQTFAAYKLAAGTVISTFDISVLGAKTYPDIIASTVCGTQTTGTKEITVTATATFTEGGSESASATFSVTCTDNSGDPPVNPTISIKNVTVAGSGDGGSYVDLDAGQVYSQSDATTTYKSDIDLIYGYGLSATTYGDVIYTPDGLKAKAGTSSAVQNLDGFSSIIPLSGTTATQATTILNQSSIDLASLSNLIASIDTEDTANFPLTNEINATDGAVFAVISSEFDIFVVKVDKSNGTVSLKLVYLNIP